MLSLRYVYKPQYQRQEKHEHSHGADEPFLLADGAKDEVCVLFRHIFQLGLGTVEKPFAGDSARADGYLRLVDVVARLPDVVLDADGDLDAHLLVRLQHTAEDVAHGEEERYRDEHEAERNGVFLHTVAHHGQGNVYGRSAEHYQEEGHAGDVHAAERQDGDYRAPAQEGEKHVACHEAVAAIEPQHPDEDGHYEDEDGELPHGHTQQQRRGILYRHHEIGDGTYHRKEYHTAHPLAVKHEDKREIDQRRPRLLLQKYQDDGHEDNDEGTEVVARLLIEPEVVGIEQFGQRQCRRELAEFGGLEAHRPEGEPGARPLDVGRYEDGQYQHKNHHAVNRVGVSLVKPVVEQHYGAAYDQREAYPHELFAGKLRKVEERRVVKIVARGIDADGAYHHQQQVEHDCHPVYGPEHRGIGFSVS